MSIANSYAVRTFGFLVYYAAIAAIVVLLIFFGETISEVVKALLIFLLGGLAQHSGTAFERFANPETAVADKYDKQLGALQQDVDVMRRENAVLYTRVEELRRTNEHLVTVIAGRAPAQPRIEDHT